MDLLKKEKNYYEKVNRGNYVFGIIYFGGFG